MYMEGSMRYGLVSVFAVSGSIVFLVHQVHKRLLTNFMKEFDFEMGTGVLYPRYQKEIGGSKKHHTKKKVRFAKEVLELPVKKKSDGIEVTRAQQVLVIEDVHDGRRGPKLEDIMPPNRTVLYREIMKYRNLKGTL